MRPLALAVPILLSGSLWGCERPDLHHGVPVAGNDCYGCHAAEYQATTDPAHEAAGFPTSCADCHSSEAWRPASFDRHDRVFPLEGAHATKATCADCHGDPPTYQGIPTECVGCHRESYEATTNPDHADPDFQFPETCADCHGTTEWRPAAFEDHERTFALTGAHASATCASCHGDPPIYTGTARECVGCHRESYEATANPDHQDPDFQFPETCADCHGTSEWRPAAFEDHEQVFALTGAHSAATCASCHGDPPRYTGTSRECVGCHDDDYRGTSDPDHEDPDFQFPETCSDCHGTTEWRPAAFEEHGRVFALTGAHSAATCASCHGDPPRYTGTSRECVGCHDGDYRGTSNPDHEARPAVYPTTCTGCHETAAWRPAAFDSHAQVFALTGAHTQASCGSCHGDPPTFTGTADTCVGCHRADYDSSPYPGHQDFPTTCLNCHSTSAWLPATGGAHPESLFPITSGHHSRIACADCHDAALGADTGGQNTNCYQCHTGDHHADRAQPHNCLSCHPDGRRGD